MMMMMVMMMITTTTTTTTIIIIIITIMMITIIILLFRIYKRTIQYYKVLFKHFQYIRTVHVQSEYIAVSVTSCG